MSSKIRVAGIGLLLLVITGLTLVLVRPGLDPAKIQPLPLVALAWIAFGAAAWLLRKVAVRVAVGLILIGGIVIQLAALSAPPQESSDLYRYMWDGRVQAAGIDPYAYAPADRGVAKLRNDFLWSSRGPGHYVDCVPNHKEPIRADSWVAGCTKLNRPKVPTIYPPVAEAYFLAVQLGAPADNSTTPIQTAAVVCALLTTLVLLYGLRLLGRNVRLAAIWAWCPLVALEAGNSAHVDVLAVLLTAVALLVLARSKTEGRTMLGGVLLGLAIATKVTPILVAPAILRRRWWFLMTAAAGTAVALVYAPHAMVVGRKIIGFLPGYLKQEGYSTGSGFNIIDLVFHGKTAMAVAVLVLGVIALAVLRYSDPENPWRGAVVMTGAALAVTTPHYQWYALLLVMLIAFDGRAEWLVLAAAGYLPAEPNMGSLTLPKPWPAVVGYGIGAIVACSGLVIRHLNTRRATPVPVPAGPVAEPAAVSVFDAASTPLDAASAPLVTVPQTVAVTSGTPHETPDAESDKPPWDDAREVHV